MYSIGEFSKISGLSIKTLRFYHDKGVLVPALVDPQSAYRYYNAANAEKARVIVALRNLGFSLNDIAELLDGHDDEAEILAYLRQQLERTQQLVDQYGEIARQLRTIITKEEEARTIMKQSSFQVQEKVIDKMLVAGVRMRGRYGDCGKGFAKIGRNFGRQICGKPLLLHYDSEYKEEDADFEACMPIRQARQVGGVAVRELPGGRCVSLLHRGPYEQLGRSYAKILDYLKQKQLPIQAPSREVYIKGPGMIFRGNPQKYVTEIQFIIEE